MAYQSLYRRYRSQRFDEVLGQDHVTTALGNAVREGRVAQGYLFSGPRGTGKTSTARILAKVLNCEHPVDGEPDTTCENCRAVEEGRQVDWLQELDAASNNGVEAMRDLLSRVSMGTSGNRKVYVLDEVHMLSTAASNALLKTLEEPPAHVVFVLATTEPEKVLPTIRSRTQHYEFNLLPADVLAEHARRVIADAGLGLGEEAVEHVVRAANGSARDMLSALDQVAAAGGVTAGTTPADDLVDALGAHDAAAALLAVDAAVRAGHDPRVLADALVSALRDAFLVAMGAPGGGLSDGASARAQQVAQAMGPATLTRALEAVGTALVDMRQAPDTRIPLEVAIVRLTRPEAADDVAALVTRIEHLERAVASGVSAPADAPAPPPVGNPDTASVAPPAPAGTPTPTPTSTPTTTPAPVTAAPAGPDRPRGADAARAKLSRRDAAPAAAPEPAAAPGSRPSLGGVRKALDAEATAAGTSAEPAGGRDTADGRHGADDRRRGTRGARRPRPAPAAGSGAPSHDELAQAWPTVLEALKPRAKALYKPGHFVAGEGRTARFALPNQAHCDRCADKRDEVAAALSSQLGRPVALELVVDEAGRAPAAPSPTAGQPAGAEEDDVDLDELTDAPDATVGPLAQLQDAFPGAELLEDQ